MAQIPSELLAPLFTGEQPSEALRVTQPCLRTSLGGLPSQRRITPALDPVTEAANQSGQGPSSVGSSLAGEIRRLNEPRASEPSSAEGAVPVSHHPNLRSRVLGFLSDPNAGTTFYWLEFPLSRYLRMDLNFLTRVQASSILISQQTNYIVVASSGIEVSQRFNADFGLSLGIMAGPRASVRLGTDLDFQAGYDLGAVLTILGR